jgi:type IX secretion system PorP/SprF family membrane protein
MSRYYFVLILFLFYHGYCYSQQSPVYSQYVLNEFLVNPAVAGIDGMTTINLSGRKQWVGLQHTPETYSASVSARLLKSQLSVKNRHLKKATLGRVGLGAAFICDKNGAINRTTFQFTYAYHIFIQNYQLSFGLKVFGTQLGIDEELIRFRDEDPRIESLLGRTAFVPDAGAGINFSTAALSLGLSASHLLESAIKFGDIELETNELEYLRNYTLHGYYRTLLPNKNWTFEPSVIIRANEKLQFSADISSRFIYNKEYWAGISVRTSGELILLAGLKWNRFYIGYSFDYGFNQLSYNSYGSHEIVLACKLGDNLRRYRWLDRY